jgi:O-antigen/teichoic acid export membrane protein
MVSSLRSRALVGSAWTTFGFGGQKFIQLCSNLVLTRLLFPEAFGLMALANVVLIGLSMFSDVGIKPSIVQHEKGDSIEFLNTAWTVQILRGFFVWVAACLLAYPASILYHQDVLFPLICCLGTTAAINGFSSTALAVKEKRVEFSAIIILQLACSSITFIVTAMLAWTFQSVWSLAAGAISGSVLTVAAGYMFLSGHTHRLDLNRAALNSMLSFGQWIFFSTIVTYLAGHGLRAIQGALIPIASFGVLSIAQMFAFAPGELVSQLISTVGFASFAEIRTRGGTLVVAVRRVRIIAFLFAFPAFFLLAALSHQIISILYDERYQQAEYYLPLIALSAAIGMVPAGYQSAVMATGNSRQHFWMISYLALARLAGNTAGFVLGDITGMLVGDAISMMSFYPVVAWAAARHKVFDPRSDLAAFFAILVATIIFISI